MNDRREFIKQAIGWTAFALADPAKAPVAVAPKISKALKAQADFAKMLEASVARRCPISMLVPRGVLPMGLGYNPGTEWRDASIEKSGFPVSNPASTVIPWNLEQRALMSEVFYKKTPKEELRFKLDDLAGLLVEILEEKDVEEYSRICRHQIVMDSRLTRNSQGFPMPLCAPTHILSPEVLDELYFQALNDGVVSELMVNDEPAFILLLSAEASINLRRQYRTMGHEGTQIDLSRVPSPLREFLSAHGSISYNGFVHCVMTMPRWDFIAGCWERRHRFTGNNNHIDLRNENALYEDAIIFNKDVMERMMESESTSIYGDARWVKRGEGFSQYVVMQQAWKPKLCGSGFVLRAKRSVRKLIGKYS